jgi:hypothetical protein
VGTLTQAPVDGTERICRYLEPEAGIGGAILSGRSR